MTKQIALTRGKVAFVSDEDFERVSEYKWCFGGHYAQRRIVIDGKRTSQAMHRFILDAPQGVDVDHKDRNRLNNTRENIRLATRPQNVANSLIVRGVSSFRGVSWRKDKKRWRATITIDGKMIYLGSFTSEVDAAHAFDAAALKVWGEFARLNFP